MLARLDVSALKLLKEFRLILVLESILKSIRQV